MYMYIYIYASLLPHDLCMYVCMHACVNVYISKGLKQDATDKDCLFQKFNFDVIYRRLVANKGMYDIR